jgi:hypothetical protein
MNTWNIPVISDDAAGISHVAPEITALASSLRTIVDKLDNIKYIWELFDQLPAVGRSVVQLHVKSQFFNEFFNSAVGYRAMFRRGPYIGTSTNAELVRVVLSSLSGKLPKTLNIHVIKNPGPEFVENRMLARSAFIRSLDPSLTKICYGTAEIEPGGAVRLLPSGVTEGKIEVGLPSPWAIIRQDQKDCIIEIKGAFI